MAAFVWGDGGAQMTPEAIAAQRKVAQAMMQRGSDYSPVQSAWQGAARLSEGLLGGLDARMADTAEQKNATAERELLASLLAGGGAALPGVAGQGGGNPAAPPPAVVAPAVPGGVPPAGDAAAAIAAIESGGKYDKLGPVTKTGDRAYGKYQVMGANVPQWTRAHLGQEMTPDQFLASPEAQDAVFKGQFGQYAGKYGPEGAAKAWFAGERGMNNPNARDQLGTSVQAYADKFSRGYGAAPRVDPNASPLDNMPWPHGNVGAPTEEASLPPNAQPAQGYAIPGQSPAVAQVAQAMPGMNPKIVAGLQSPYTSDATKKILGIMLQQQMKQNEFGFQSQPDGTILRTNPRTGTVEPVYQGATKPTFGIIGEDADGKKAYGFIDAAKGKVTPLEPAKPGDQRPTVTGPDGTKIVIPEGVDVKKFRSDVTSATADAATGKKTEVQGSAEQFANRLELAEKNFQGLEKEASGPAGVAQTIAGKIPVVGAFAQSGNFQKMDQAKSQFITALLRKESGAAIGKEEFTRYDKEFFPQPGNPPEVIAQKAEARRVAIEAMKKTAGPGYKSPTMAPPAAAVTKSIGGKEYYQENGQWYEK
jgi:hypothetical protein